LELNVDEDHILYRTHALPLSLFPGALCNPQSSGGWPRCRGCKGCEIGHPRFGALGFRRSTWIDRALRGRCVYCWRGVCSGLFCIIRLHNGILMNATVLLVWSETFYDAENYNIGLNYRRRGWGLTLFKNRLRIRTGHRKIILTIISVNHVCFSKITTHNTGRQYNIIVSDGGDNNIFRKWNNSKREQRLLNRNIN